jgi:hypothetical protein
MEREWLKVISSGWQAMPWRGTASLCLVPARAAECCRPHQWLPPGVAGLSLYPLVPIANLSAAAVNLCDCTVNRRLMQVNHLKGAVCLEAPVHLFDVKQLHQEVVGQG